MHHGSTENTEGQTKIQHELFGVNSTPVWFRINDFEICGVQLIKRCDEEAELAVCFGTFRVLRASVVKLLRRAEIARYQLGFRCPHGFL
jgi:hypothetical protein